MRQTPSQTVGPFLHYALLDEQGTVSEVDPEGVAGTPVIVEGSVTDGGGGVVADAMVETWQADGGGRYRHLADGRSPDVPDEFIGFGRVGSQADGTFRIVTVMPGTVPGRDGSAQAPHLNVHVFARGLLDLLTTRIYFEDQLGNDDDPVLSTVPHSRRSSLIARLDGDVDGVPRYRFDIVLQGEGETVFFDA
jgi:protocatechuate 3,4-dioxygenase, alpha subunit